MPVLGVGGVLELRRELPDPVLVSPEGVAPSTNVIDVGTDGFWTGDQVWVWGPVGLPFDLNNDELPDVRGGWGMFYGSKYLLYGARKTRLSTGASKWFGAEAPFRAPDIEGLVDRTELFVYKDELDRLAFYRTFNEALAGDPTNRLKFYAVDFRFLLVAPVGSTGYQERIAPVYPELVEYQFPQDLPHIPLLRVTTAAVPEPDGIDDDRPWNFVAEMEDWSLELDANSVEITALGERFGESTRALVTGGGQLDFYVSRSTNTDEADATALARLLITLEKGSKAEAVFHVTNKDGLQHQSSYPNDRQKSSVSYHSSILLVTAVTNTSADDVIRGSARFVTVGRVRLTIN